MYLCYPIGVLPSNIALYKCILLLSTEITTLFMPCHHPTHHALQSTQAALPYCDDMGADALDGVLIKKKAF
jgi:hypothetical protein